MSASTKWSLKQRVAIPYKAFSGHDLIMIVYANWRILLAVGWIIKLPKLSIMEQKSVENASGAYKEADDISSIIDLDEKGILCAGEIKRTKDAVLYYESVNWGIDHRRSIAPYDYPILVDSAHACFSGTRKPENVKDSVVQ